MPWRFGEQQFERCPFKVVNFVELVYVRGNTGPMVVSENPLTETRIKAGNGASLNCPVTRETGQEIRSEYSDHASQVAAVNSIRRLAGKLLCQNCPYAGMTPAQFDYDQAERMRAQAARNYAAAELFQSQRHLQEITGEAAFPYLLPSERPPEEGS